MMAFKRDPHNPLLGPRSEVEWDAFASFNGSVVKEGSQFLMLYRAMSRPRRFSGQDLRVSSIGGATSPDGSNFDHRFLFLRPNQPWNRFGCEDPRIVKVDGRYLVFYTAIGEYPFTPEGIRVAVAVTDNMTTVRENHLVTPFNAKAMVMFPEKIGGKYWAVLTVDTDQPPAHIAMVSFLEIADLWNHEMWQRWYAELPLHVLSLSRLNTDHVEVGANPIKTSKGWLLIYSHIRNYYSDQRIFGIEAVLLDASNPRNIIARTDEPLLLPSESYEKKGVVPNVIFPSASILEGDTVHLYYGGGDTYCLHATSKIDDIFAAMKPTARVPLQVKRAEVNPIIFALWEHPWEQSNVFNPGAFYADGKFHIVYRAQAENGTSCLGYATSRDGITIDERLPDPIYYPRTEFEIKINQTGNSGCEDPRLVVFEQQILMFYTAYNGVNEPRVALTQIPLNDFLARHWNMWSLPRIISPPGMMDKNACVFPEKIDGKFVFLHRIGSNIVFDFRDDLLFAEPDPWLRSLREIPSLPHSWDSMKIGISAPPIKTNRGWILLYHGVSSYDRHYRVGAMLLDLKEPWKVLARTADPILQPETSWERKGFVNNVVFPCGAVEHDGKIFIYYGGSDTVVGVAVVGLNDLLEYLTQPRNPLSIQVAQ